MSDIQNSDLIDKTIKTLLSITSRRASESVSVLLMDIILKALVEKYRFLKHVKMKSTLGYGEITANTLIIDSDINSVDSTTIGRAIESIVRILYIDLGKKAGLFFIKELKDRLGGDYVSALKGHGVDLDLIQLERDYALKQQKRRESQKTGATGETEKPREEATILGYKWGNVTTWRYENNMCLLYDKNGKLLDKLHLDQIVENHVREITEPEVSPEMINEYIKIDEDQYKLLKLLYSRDLDMDEAKHMMDKSKPEIEYMVYELISAEFLRHDSDNTVKLTGKGIEYLLSEEEKKSEVKNNEVTKEN